MERTKDLVDQMMEYECFILNDSETLNMFAEMIKSGMAWSLQGHYGRTASSLIEDGWIDRNGNLLKTL
jgi:hypothetical protein